MTEANTTQRVLVLGAYGGTGLALSQLLLANGAKVFLAGRDANRLQELSAQLGMPYGLADASDPDAIDA